VLIDRVDESYSSLMMIVLAEDYTSAIDASAME
jgi:hypothetical protein